jgi:hypothetical protein
LILGEPTSVLDVSVHVVILRLLQDLKRQLDLSSKAGPPIGCLPQPRIPTPRRCYRC